MKTSDFDYTLPPEMIAQTPVEPRHAARLLVLERRTGKMEHTRFREIGSYLEPGDLLVVNQTRVIPARMYARKSSGGKIEVLLLNKKGETTWEVLVGGKRMDAGKSFSVIGGPQGTILEVLEGSRRMVQFDEQIEPFLNTAGHVPLPPYIHETLQDRERYQTVYAAMPGSAAAPTAGLHFTRELMDRLSSRGIGFASVDLQVGLDTFAPVTEEDAEEHTIHCEWCSVPVDVVEEVRRTKAAGKRVVAVGTTSMRSLESAAIGAEPGEILHPVEGQTGLFILPGYSFKVVDALITNFHLPRSTLLMLVSAFAGRECILKTYQAAIEDGYRFYSFGDAMLIL